VIDLIKFSIGKFLN